MGPIESHVGRAVDVGLLHFKRSRAKLKNFSAQKNGGGKRAPWAEIWAPNKIWVPKKRVPMSGRRDEN
jgi:hypothetical protein